jgi:hypothetical protein
MRLHSPLRSTSAAKSLPALLSSRAAGLPAAAAVLPPPCLCRCSTRGPQLRPSSVGCVSAVDMACTHLLPVLLCLHCRPTHAASSKKPRYKSHLARMQKSLLLRAKVASQACLSRHNPCWIVECRSAEQQAKNKLTYQKKLRTCCSACHSSYW